MGFWPSLPEKEAERELPKYDIAGTEFYVDMKRDEFRQVDNPYNRMTLGSVKEEMGFSHFFYDTRTKNLYLGDTKNADKIPEHVRLILVPPLKELDPIGLAKRQGFKIPDHQKPNLQKTKKLHALSKAQEPQKKKRKGFAL